MAGSKTLYNSTSLDAVLEALARLWKVTLDPNFATITIDTTHALVTVVALPQAADGRKPLYSGSLTIPYVKQDIQRMLPQDIVYGETYPIAYDRLKMYLKSSYDYLVEDGEFYIVGDSQEKPLMPGDIIGVTPDPVSGRIVLGITPQAGRWRAGGQFPITITAPGALAPSNQLKISGDAPDAIQGAVYDFTYTAINGVPPLTWTIVEGVAPGVLDPASGSLHSDEVVGGVYQWTIRCTDASGRFQELADQATIKIPNVTIANPYGGRTTVNAPISYQYMAQNGQPPYTYSAPKGLPRGLTLSASGALAGLVDGGSYLFDVKATDSLGNTVTIHDSLSVLPRTTALVIGSLWSKLGHWFDQDDGPLRAGGSMLDRHGHLTLTTSGPIGSTLGKTLGALVYNATASAQATGTGPAFSNDFAIMLDVNSPGSGLNQGIVGRMDTNLAGWALSSNADDGTLLELQFRQSDVLYRARSTQAYADHTWKNALIQRSGAYVDFIFDGGPAQTTQTVAGPIDPPVNSLLTVGQRTDFPTGTNWTGTLGNIVLFTDKLWSDEAAWLLNGGVGRTYAELKALATNQTLVPLVISGTPDQGHKNQPYSYAFTVTGGQPPYSRARLMDGSLPDGLNLSVVGNTVVLSGTPTIEGSMAFTLALDDSMGQDAIYASTITIPSSLDDYAKLALTYSPYFYYQNEESSGSLVDFSGNGLTATVSDGAPGYRQPSIRPDGVGHAIRFDGASAFSIPGQVGSSPQGWLAVWVLPDATVDERMLYTEGTFNGPYLELYQSVDYDPNQIPVWTAGTLSGLWSKSVGRATQSVKPIHLLLTWNATHKAFYTDGKLTDIRAQNGQISTMPSTFFGRESRWLKSAFKGLAQNLGSGTQYLTSTQVQALFQAGGGQLEGIASRYWRFLMPTLLDGTQTMASISRLVLRDSLGNPNNLAYLNDAGVATASSSTGGLTAGFAFNQNTDFQGTAYWQSGNQTADWWAAYDFGPGQKPFVTEVGVESYNAQGQAPARLEVQTSDDGLAWRTVALWERTNDAWPVNTLQTLALRQTEGIASSLYTKTVAWWEYDPTATAIRDKHLLSLHPTAVNVSYPGAALGAELSGSAILNASLGSALSVTDPALTLPKELACLLWAQLDGTPVSFYPKLMWKTGLTSNGDGNYLFQQDQFETGTLRFRVSNATSAYNDAVSPAPMPLNTPLMLLGQRVVDTVQLWEGKQLMASAPMAGPAGSTNVATPSKPLVWGAAGSTRDPVNGKLMPSAVFKQSLTYNEIAYLYNGARGRRYDDMYALASVANDVACGLMDAMVSWWDFDVDGRDSHGSSSFLANSAPLNTIDQSVLRPGKLRSALYCPLTPKALDIRRNWSTTASQGAAIVGWFKLVPVENAQVLCGLSNGGGRGESYYLAVLNTGAIAASFRLPDGTAAQGVSSAALDPTVFHHVVANFSDTTMELWIDNVLVSSVTQPTPGWQAPTEWDFGSRYVGYGMAAYGSAISTYKRMITATEIAHLYNGGAGRSYRQMYLPNGAV